MQDTKLFETILGITAPWHLLYFRPLPHGHGSLRPTDMDLGCGDSWKDQYTCAVVASSFE